MTFGPIALWLQAKAQQTPNTILKSNYYQTYSTYEMYAAQLMKQIQMG